MGKKEVRLMQEGNGGRKSAKGTGMEIDFQMREMDMSKPKPHGDPLGMKLEGKKKPKI